MTNQPSDVTERPFEMATHISGPVAVIGDVHGHVEPVRELLDKLQQLPDYQDRWIVFIGDLVDRGPDPKGMIDLLLQLIVEHPRTACVAGNHELAMAGALGLIETPEYADWSKRWLDHYGSEATFASYGVSFGELDVLRDSMPVGHRAFLRTVPWCIEHASYFFVHAGLDPYLGFDLQREVLQSRDFSLSRPQWLCSKRLTFSSPPQDCDRIVVSGHARVDEVTIREKRMLIDTSGGRVGNISCVLLPEHEVLQADTGDPSIGNSHPKDKE